MQIEKFNANNEQDFEKENLEKHKDKLTGFYLMNGDQRYIFSRLPEFSDVEITPENRNAVIENMKNGVDYSGIEKKLLSDMAGPEHFESLDEVFSHLANDKHQKRILAYMTNEKWDQYNRVDGDNVIAFLEAYPTPMDFERDSDDFLREIERYNSRQKGLEYREAMEEFKNNVYGKKYEYYKAMQDFHREANERKSQDVQSIETSELTNLVGEMGPNGYTEIDRREAMSILKETSLEGDPISLTQHPREKISAEKLLRSELEPRFRFQFEDVNFNTSRAFKIGSRDAIICYVNTPDGRMSARSYYRSNSQGVWRYLPDYETNASGNIVEWYGKGSGEQQLTLPMEIQGTLNNIAKQSYNERRDQDTTYDMVECFYGTAKKIEDGIFYSARRKNGLSGDALDAEVDNRPTVKLTGSLKDLSPEEMYLDNRSTPNFNNQIGEFDMESGIYDNAKVRLFRSNDGSLTWSIIENADGKACVAGVEMKSRITSTGLREKWVDAGDFAMPLYEYSMQTYGLGDRTDRKENYLGMWKYCLSKMPIIRAYKRRSSGKNVTAS